MRKLLFNYSFYSHPEIGKFQGVTIQQQRLYSLLPDTVPKRHMLWLMMCNIQHQEPSF
jgi:hypothetical protein